MTHVTAPPEGLRERKKARTREALVSSALDLFCSRGFDATTTEEIAACADVSQRTLFRYFASKDEIVLSIQEDVERVFLERLRERPLDEHPYTALTNAVRDARADLPDATMVGQLRVMALLSETPRLLAARLAAGDRHQARLTALIAERTGTDPACDVRPALLAGAFCAAMNVAMNSTCRLRARPDAADLFDTIESHLGVLGPAVSEPWADAPPL